MGIIVRQSIKGTVVTYAGALLGVLTTFVVLTRWLTAEEIGLTRVLVDAATMLVALSQLGTSSSIIRFFPYFKDEQRHDHGFFFWTMVVPLVGFALFGALYCLLSGPMAGVFGGKSPLFVQYYYVVLPIAFAMLYQTVLETNANVLMRIVVPRLVREVVVRLLTLAVYLLYAFRVIGLDAFVWSFCAVYGVAALINMAYLVSLGRVSLKPDFSFLTRDLVRNYLWYTLFLITSTLAGVLAPTLSSFFVTAQMGLASTGIYAIATYISYMVSMPYRSLGAIAQPEISQSVKDGDLGRTNTLSSNVALHQLLVGGFVFMLIWFNIDAIFALLPNGSEYAQGKWVVLILCSMQLFTSTLSIAGSVLNYSRYYYLSLVFTALLTVLSLVLNNRLIPLWGMEGAALASLGANVVYYACMQLVLWKVVGHTLLSRRQLWVLLLMLGLFALNLLWTRCLTPLLPGGMMSMLSDSLLRTLVLLGGGFWLVCKLNISPEINKIIKEVRIKRS